MPDLTLYRDDATLLLIALTTASARYERQGLMEVANDCNRLSNKIMLRYTQGLHPAKLIGESE